MYAHEHFIRSVRCDFLDLNETALVLMKTSPRTSSCNLKLPLFCNVYRYICLHNIRSIITRKVSLPAFQRSIRRIPSFCLSSMLLPDISVFQPTFQSADEDTYLSQFLRFVDLKLSVLAVFKILAALTLSCR